MQFITEHEAVNMIHGTDGKIFSCTFIKRTNGEIRQGRFRLGHTVKKGLAGGPAAYSPSAKRLVWVYRMAGDESGSGGQRRAIPYEGILTLSVQGKEFAVCRVANAKLQTTG